MGILKWMQRPALFFCYFENLLDSAPLQRSTQWDIFFRNSARMASLPLWDFDLKRLFRSFGLRNRLILVLSFVSLQAFRNMFFNGLEEREQVSGAYWGLKVMLALVTMYTSFPSSFS